MTRSVVIFAVLPLVAALLSGCSSEPAPKPAAQVVQTPAPYTTPIPTPQPTPLAQPTLREVQPSKVGASAEPVTICILGSGFPADPADLKVWLECGGERKPLPNPDAVTGGEEIIIMDRSFEGFAAGTYSVIVETSAGLASLPGGLTIEAP